MDTCEEHNTRCVMNVNSSIPWFKPTISWLQLICALQPCPVDTSADSSIIGEPDSSTKLEEDAVLASCWPDCEPNNIKTRAGAIRIIHYP